MSDAIVSDIATPAPHYSGQRVALLSQHGKEAIIAPVLV